MKNKSITKISVSDIGTFSTAEHDGKTLKVLNSGGCPVETLLADVDWDTDDLSALALDVLIEWESGYDGDPSENGLRVEITRDGKTASVKS